MARRSGRRPRPERRPAIRVRMYRQGLGDCFLVSLLRPRPPHFHMMIDCGVILGTANARGRLERVVRDVIATTGGRINVLAVTHEHYDHVAAFTLLPELFAPTGSGAGSDEGKLGVDQVWFAWTEDPADTLAGQIREDRERRQEALANFAARLAGLRAAAGTMAAEDDDFGLGFFGAGKGGKPGATADAMARAAAFAPAGKTLYLLPGALQAPEAAPELRVFVLGPPRDADVLRKLDSRTEVYHLGEAYLLDAVSFAAGDGDIRPGKDPAAPFGRDWVTSLSAIEQGKAAGTTAAFIRQHYFGTGAASAPLDPSWRRIDQAWLDSADRLALALDSATNNTSLALAIEPAGCGKVLLFPADAQVGNWLSWQDLSWRVEGAEVTGEDLLRRTAFYKVGHHGSHNATLRAKGLEMMQETGLVAFVPVDREMAVRKHWNRMPLPGLIDALRDRCGDHLIRLDEPLPPGLADVRASRGTFAEGDPLYYEWELPL